MVQALRRGDENRPYPHGFASTRLNGKMNNMVPFTPPPKSRNIAGDFHRPYENSKNLSFSNHRSTLPQLRCAQQLPQRGSREAFPFIGVLAKIRGFGRFSSPLRNSEVGTFHHSSCRPETGGGRAIFIAPTKRPLPNIKNPLVLMRLCRSRYGSPGGDFQ